MTNSELPKGDAEDPKAKKKRRRRAGPAPGAEWGSISDVAALTSECEWSVKRKLREGIYRAKKSGRRTLIELASVRGYVASLPEAKFAPPRPRRVSQARV